jgi:superoxide dismutase, Fe-Mn family
MMTFTRREMLRTAGAGVATLSLASLAAGADEAPKGYTLPKLPYAYDALEPSIDEKTMRIHHDKHHAAYVAGANKALAKHPKLLAKPVDALLADITSVPMDIRRTVANMAGGHSNHTIFWEIMGPKGGGEPKGALAKAIDAQFGSFDKFQKELSTKAATVFGSGWGWLVVNPKKELEIIQRANQDSPYMTGHTPLVGIDVWEHAYYLKYQNVRPAYVAAWWKVANWSAISDRAAAAMKS